MEPTEYSYNYKLIVDELLSNNLILEGEAYFYFDNPIEIVFENFFQFCQNNLSGRCLENGYNIEPTRFYYFECEEVNAAAYPIENGYFRIEINKGTIEKLFSKFCDSDVLNDPQLIDYKVLNEYYEKPPYNASIGYMMLQGAILFTYYHELGHLIQFSNQQTLYGHSNERKVINERYIKNDDDFDFASHVDEFDSDLHGAQELAAHVWTFWENLPRDIQTYDSLEKLIIIALVGVLGFFTMLLDSPKTKIYFYEYTHPYPLMRLLWISQSLVSRLSLIYPSINREYILSESLRVLDIFFKYKDAGTIQQRYIEALQQNTEEVKQYMYKINDIAKGPGFEYLVSNTIHRR